MAWNRSAGAAISRKNVKSAKPFAWRWLVAIALAIGCAALAGIYFIFGRAASGGKPPEADEKPVQIAILPH